MWWAPPAAAAPAGAARRLCARCCCCGCLAALAGGAAAQLLGQLLLAQLAAAALLGLSLHSLVLLSQDQLHVAGGGHVGVDAAVGAVGPAVRGEFKGGGRSAAAQQQQQRMEGKVSAPAMPCLARIARPCRQHTPSQPVSQPAAQLPPKPATLPCLCPLAPDAPAAALLRLVDLDVGDVQGVDIQALALRVALRVGQQAQQELGALLGPPALPNAVLLVLGLAGAPNAACREGGG